MGFLEDLGRIFMPTTTTGGPIGPALPGLPPVAPGVTVTADEDFFGFRPGFDIGDIFDVGGRLLRAAQGEAPAPFMETPFPRGGGFPGRESLPEIGPGPGAALLADGANGAVAKVRTSMYIAGTTPGLWHTTPQYQRFDPRTGAARIVGGNRRPNPISIAQDETGALQFFAPVEPSGWRMKYKSGPRRHPRRGSPHAHRRRRNITRRRKAGHKHRLTRKQLAAGFGGRAHMRAH